jgi:hypothetical protein
VATSDLHPGCVRTVGVEYSVVSQDDFGHRAQIKLNVIPVIPALIHEPVFGGE